MNLPVDPQPAEEDPPRTTPPADRETLDRIFGEVLPDTTSDERDPRDEAGAASDDWYRDNRPPHHEG